MLNGCAQGRHPGTIERGFSMTARSERAVRAGPGPASDRRDTVGSADVTVVRTSSHRVQVPSRDFDRVQMQSELTFSSSATRHGISLVTSGARQGFASTSRTTHSDLCEINRHCGTLEMLVALASTGSATQYELRREVRSGYCALSGSLKCLMDLGLIRSEREASLPFRLRYQLTECARVLASALIDWQHLVYARQEPRRRSSRMDSR